MDNSLFQKLTEHEMDFYLNEIDLALEFHIKWLSQINRLLICKSRSNLQQKTVNPSNDDHFERWYNSIQDIGLREMSAFIILGKTYDEMVNAAKELFSKAAQKGNICNKEYDQFISLTTALRQQINILKGKIKSDFKLVAKIMGKVFENTEEGVMITDVNSNIMNVNQSFVRVTQYTKKEVLGKKPSILHSGKQDLGFYERMWDELNQKHRWQGEVWNRRKNNDIYPEWLSITAVRDDNGVTSHYIGIFSDISTESESNERLYHLAHYDNLSKLPNRMLFYDRLRQSLSRTKRSKQTLAVFFIDLDDFKVINDKYGHESGDRILQLVSQQLVQSLRESDTVARIGGDEFTAIINDIEDAAVAAELAEKILQSVEKEYKVDGHSIKLSASIGISLYTEENENADLLVKQADIAMYKAKEEGKNRYKFFDPSIE